MGPETAALAQAEGTACARIQHMQGFRSRKEPGVCEESERLIPPRAV